jgi:hypothetical protein
MSTKYYVGVKKNYHCDIFRSKELVTEKTHGIRYLFCYGGYSSLKNTIRVAMYHNYFIDTPRDKSIV